MSIEKERNNKRKIANKHEAALLDKIKPFLRVSRAYDQAISHADILKGAVTDLKSIWNLKDKNVPINTFFECEIKNYIKDFNLSHLVRTILFIRKTKVPFILLQ